MTPAISEYVEKNLDKIRKLVGSDESIKCDVEIGRTTAHHNKGDIFHAEIHIYGHKTDIYSRVERSDLYIVIDEAVNDAFKSLNSKRKRYMTMVRKGGAKVKAMVRGMWPWKGGNE